MFSQYALRGGLSRKLAIKVSELDNFHCGMDLQKALNDKDLAKKVVFIDRRKTCESSVENLVYRTKQANMYVCGWCAQELKRNECLKLVKSMSAYSEVIPNCESLVCLAQNSGDPGGWRMRSAEIEAEKAEE